MSANPGLMTPHTPWDSLTPEARRRERQGGSGGVKDVRWRGGEGEGYRRREGEGKGSGPEEERERMEEIDIGRGEEEEDSFSRRVVQGLVSGLMKPSVGQTAAHMSSYLWVSPPPPPLFIPSLSLPFSLSLPISLSSSPFPSLPLFLSPFLSLSLLLPLPSLSFCLSPSPSLSSCLSFRLPLSCVWMCVTCIT